MARIEREPRARPRVDRRGQATRDLRRRRTWAPRATEPERPVALPGRSWRAALVAGTALAAGSLAFVFPLTPGFTAPDTTAAIIAAAVVAGLAVGVVALAWALAPKLAAAPPRDRLMFAAALLSAGAAAVHFAVAKTHLDEYALFGVFFVAAGVGQLVWPLWLSVRAWRPLLVLGALGNGAIAALWAVDRIWGLPLGPSPWTPDPIGFGDSVTSGFEVLLVAACVVLLRRDRGRSLGGWTAATLLLGTGVLTGLSLLSVLGVWSSILAPTA